MWDARIAVLLEPVRRAHRVARLSAILSLLCFNTSAQAMACNHMKISLGDTLQHVQRVCLQPWERIHTFERTRVITDTASGRVHAYRHDRYADEMVYWDSVRRIKITLLFRDDVLTEITKQFYHAETHTPKHTY